LVGVWTQKNYVEEAIPYLRIFEDKINDSEKIVFCGDFNSSSVFNDKHKGKDHDDMVKLFDSMGLKSIYHENTGENHGEETTPTFYEYLHEDEAYHLDYVFAEPENVCNLEIGTYDEYVGCDEKKSDHVPLIFNLKE
jgi:exonuclease III